MIRLHGSNGLYIESDSRWIGGDSKNPAAGMVRWDQDKQCFQIYTGHSWVDYVRDFELTLSPAYKEIAEWVHNKMDEEENLEKKLDKYPALREAYEKFKVLEALVNREEKSAV